MSGDTVIFAIIPACLPEFKRRVTVTPVTTAHTAVGPTTFTAFGS